MPQLLVRDVPQDVVEALKRRAAQHGRIKTPSEDLIRQDRDER
jgi:plasmid stability protein